MSIEVYFLYLATLFVYFTAPPDSTELLVVSNSLRHGYKRTLNTIAGDLTANTIQMTVAAFGLGAIIYTSANALTWIKWFGVAYLMWMAISLFFKRSAPGIGRHKAAESRINLFQQGFVTSAVNPYAIIFFTALFPQFIDPADAILPQLLILGATVLLFDFVSLTVLGLAATQAARHLKQVNFAIINKVSGGFRMLAAYLLATKDLEVEARK
ncbi:MAG: LysE family translocator [Pseudomonadota bacterium]